MTFKTTIVKRAEQLEAADRFSRQQAAARQVIYQHSTAGQGRAGAKGMSGGANKVFGFGKGTQHHTKITKAEKKEARRATHYPTKSWLRW